MASFLVARTRLMKRIKDSGLQFSGEAHQFLNRVVDTLIEKAIAKAKAERAKRIKAEHFQS